MNVELMKQAIAVAVIQLFEGYPGDVLKKFTLEELEGFCEITEPLRPEQVENIYRNAWDHLRAAPSAPERKPMTDAEIDKAARQSGAIAYTNRFIDGSSFSFGPEALRNFVRLVEAIK